MATIPIPDTCPKCSSTDIVPAGDRMATCMDCGAMAEFVFEDEDENPRHPPISFDLRGARIHKSFEGLIKGATENPQTVLITPPSKSIIQDMINFPDPKSKPQANPPHIVCSDNADTCDDKQKQVGPTDRQSAVLAHEIYDAFAWITWVSVHRAAYCYTVRIKHAYPIDVLPSLRAWLNGHEYKRGGAFFVVLEAD